jgi:hypothetical protein
MHPTQQGRGKGETGDEDNCPIPIQGPRVGREAVPVACGDTIPEATFISGMAITHKLPNGRSFLLRARGCGSLATWQIRTAEMERSKRQLYLPFHMWPPVDSSSSQPKFSGKYRPCTHLHFSCTVKLPILEYRRCYISTFDQTNVILEGII